MSRTTRHTLLVAAYAVLIALWAWPYVLWQPARLKHAGFDQIRLGMTQPEVEALLGGPPGLYYPSYPGAGAGGTAEFYEPPAGCRGETWYDHSAEYTVWFGPDGRVAAKHKRTYWYTTTHTIRHLYFHNIWTFLALGWLLALVAWHAISWFRAYWQRTLDRTKRRAAVNNSIIQNDARAVTGSPIDGR
jgi:hypothetical protein